jgi:hypothetical protein
MGGIGLLAGRNSQMIFESQDASSQSSSALKPYKYQQENFNPPLS